MSSVYLRCVRITVTADAPMHSPSPAVPSASDDDDSSGSVWLLHEHRRRRGVALAVRTGDARPRLMRVCGLSE